MLYIRLHVCISAACSQQVQIFACNKISVYNYFIVIRLFLVEKTSNLVRFCIRFLTYSAVCGCMHTWCYVRVLIASYNLTSFNRPPQNLACWYDKWCLRNSYCFRWLLCVPRGRIQPVSAAHARQSLRRLQHVPLCLWTNRIGKIIQVQCAFRLLAVRSSQTKSMKLWNVILSSLCGVIVDLTQISQCDAMPHG